MNVVSGADPAGAARADPAAGGADSTGAGAGGADPTDHHPAAANRNDCWAEPGRVDAFSLSLALSLTHSHTHTYLHTSTYNIYMQPQAC